MVYKFPVQNPDSLIYGVCVDESKKCIDAISFLSNIVTEKDKVILIHALHTSQ